MTDPIQYRNIAELRTSPNNYRRGDVGAIITSILTFGFNNALRVWQGGIVKAGNHTLLAIQSIKAQGLTAPQNVQVRGNGWYVPCIDISHLSQTEADAFLIADNRLSEIAENDDTQLAALLSAIASEDETLLRATGYDGDDLDALLQTLADDALAGMQVTDVEPQIDKADELQKKWQTSKGQLWIIPSKRGKGEHRLLCGDSTNAEDVARVMGKDKAPLMVTDPPYNVAQETELYAQNSSKALKQLAESEWDKGFNPLLFLEATKTTLKRDCWQYIFTAHNLFGQIFEWLNERHDKTSFCVWCKPNPMPSLSKTTWTFATELCLLGRSGSPVFNYPDGEHCFNWWAINKASDGSHPTQKTLEVIQHIVTHCSRQGDIVNDFFIGSGTTLVACEQTGRLGRGIEIDARYVAVSLQRLADMGLQPRLSNL